jgi:hypothetical protein
MISVAIGSTGGILDPVFAPSGRTAYQVLRPISHGRNRCLIAGEVCLATKRL